MLLFEEYGLTRLCRGVDSLKNLCYNKSLLGCYAGIGVELYGVEPLLSLKVLGRNLFAVVESNAAGGEIGTFDNLTVILYIVDSYLVVKGVGACLVAAEKNICLVGVGDVECPA